MHLTKQTGEYKKKLGFINYTTDVEKQIEEKEEPKKKEKETKGCI